MRTMIAMLLAASALLGGCCTVDDPGKAKPIVAPAVITNGVQDANDPTLPHYIPWWAGDRNND